MERLPKCKFSDSFLNLIYWFELYSIGKNMIRFCALRIRPL